MTMTMASIFLWKMLLLTSSSRTMKTKQKKTESSQELYLMYRTHCQTKYEWIQILLNLELSSYIFSLRLSDNSIFVLIVTKNIVTKPAPCQGRKSEREQQHNFQNHGNHLKNRSERQSVPAKSNTAIAMFSI